MNTVMEVKVELEAGVESTQKYKSLISYKIQKFKISKFKIQYDPK